LLQRSASDLTDLRGRGCLLTLLPSPRNEPPVSELMPVFTAGRLLSARWEARRCRLPAAVRRSSRTNTIIPRRVHSQLNKRYSPIFYLLKCPYKSQQGTFPYLVARFS